MYQSSKYKFCMLMNYGRDLRTEDSLGLAIESSMKRTSSSQRLQMKGKGSGIVYFCWEVVPYSEVPLYQRE